VPQTPQFSGAAAKLFGENSAFTATVEMHMKDAAGDLTTMPGRMAFDSGKTRFEMDMAGIKSKTMSADSVEQMRAMGMDKMTAISLPEQKKQYLVFPGLKAYADMPIPDAGSSTAVVAARRKVLVLLRDAVDLGRVPRLLVH
jgi:hypothetical protein